jgi:hypothetical protein
MQKMLVLAAVAALALASVADAKQCKDTTTGKFIKCPPPAAAPAATSSATGKAAPHCTKGKPCGNTCIKTTDVCHKS